MRHLDQATSDRNWEPNQVLPNWKGRLLEEAKAGEEGKTYVLVAKLLGVGGRDRGLWGRLCERWRLGGALAAKDPFCLGHHGGRGAGGGGRRRGSALKLAASSSDASRARDCCLPHFLYIDGIPHPDLPLSLRNPIASQTGLGLFHRIYPRSEPHHHLVWYRCVLHARVGVNVGKLMGHVQHTPSATSRSYAPDTAHTWIPA